MYGHVFTCPATNQKWLRALRPAEVIVDRRERLRVSIGATLGLLLAAFACHHLAGALHSPLPCLVAPLGASAALVFGVPASPLAQPWAVVAGNTFAALVGVACARWIAPVELAAALAVGGATMLMFALRCPHPPGGASALLIVLIGITDPSVALFPVLLNSLLRAGSWLASSRNPTWSRRWWIWAAATRPRRRLMGDPRHTNLRFRV